jgi:hypothetical protein
MTTNYRNQNRQPQRALTYRKNQKINNKKQTVIKITQIKINRKIKNQNNKLQSDRGKSARLSQPVPAPMD